MQKDFGHGDEAALAKVELSPDGRITLAHSGTEIGTGASSGQAVACVRWLGRPADNVQMPVTDWPDLIVETSGDPYAMEQTEQDRLARNPRWSPDLCNGIQCQQLGLLFRARDTGGGADRLSSWAVAGGAGDLAAWYRAEVGRAAGVREAMRAG